MKNRFFPALVLGAALGGCIFSGGGSDTETLTGVVLPGAAITPLARVKLILADHNPANPGSAAIRITQTDTAGRFRFDAVGGGYYNLIAVNATGHVAFAESLRAGGVSPTLTLAPPLNWFVGLGDSVGVPPDSGVIYFPGTDILARCDGLNDVEVDSIPAGLRRIRAESRAGWSLETALAAPLDSALIRARPDGITVVGGPGWLRLTGGTQSDLNSVYFVNADTGWAVGAEGTILKTADGGMNWIPQSGGGAADLHSVYFVDADSGYAAGSSLVLGGVLLKTTDGGNSWSSQAAGSPQTLRSVHFPDPGASGAAITGYAVGDSGTVFKTTDGGATWSAQVGGTTGDLYSVYFTDSLHGHAVGILSGGGITVETLDGGSTWTQRLFRTGAPLRSVHFPAPDAGYAVGDWGNIFKSTDSGTSWQPQTSGITATLKSVYFTSADTGYAAGDGALAKTVDGGATWTQPFPLPMAVYNSVYFPTPGTGFVAGSGGTLLKLSPP